MIGALPVLLSCKLAIRQNQPRATGAASRDSRPDGMSAYLRRIERLAVEALWGVGGVRANDFSAASAFWQFTLHQSLVLPQILYRI